eukprot:c25357_g1_i1 orf=340-1659(+)
MAEWQYQHVGQIAVPPNESLCSNLASKRQRRPSVRLGEIGDPPAAILSESYLKRRNPPFETGQSRQGYIVANYDGNDSGDSTFGHGKTGRVSKIRPLLHVTGDDLEQKLPIGIHGEEGYNVLGDPMSSNNHPSGEDDTYARIPSYSGVPGGSLPAILRTSSMKGRNAKRRRGVLAPIEKLTRAFPSIIEIDDNEHGKVSCMVDTTDPLSDVFYDTDTPEGIRDCDLETSDGLTDAKEMSNSQGDELHEIIAMKSTLEHQQRYDGSQQTEGGDAVTPDIENSDAAGEDKEVSANDHIGPMVDSPCEKQESPHDVGISPMAEKSVKPIPVTKLILEANGNLNDRLPHKSNVDEQIEHSQLEVGQCAPLVNDVKGWLYGLGLAKYVPVFEAHEVDSVVLPLLTLDDLREMGINAVGTRRKMFCAIQNLGKGLKPQPDTLQGF